MPKYNRLRILLAEREKNASWLADQMGRANTGVARWVRNESQPHVATLYQIAKILGVTVHDILVPELPEEEDLPAAPPDKA